MRINRKTAVLAALVALSPMALTPHPAAAAPDKPAARAKQAPAKPGVTARPGAPQTNPLGLTDAQLKKLNAIRAKAQADSAAVQKGKGTDEQKRQKIMAIAKRADAEVGKVLTPAQKKKIDQARNQQMAAMKQAQANQAAFMKTLTPAQKTKLEAIQSDFQKRGQSLMANKSLSNQQKQQKYMALMQEMDGKMNAVLTAKQRAMLKKR